ncbi:hypothetical protein [Nocardia cerradoensis]|nr:hypothetical protein [Nocardia cerradoensis]
MVRSPVGPDYMGIIGNIMFHMSRSIAIICMHIVDHLLPVV